jgi:hypothetical protein
LNESSDEDVFLQSFEDEKTITEEEEEIQEE